jgi:hypothetical protein
MVDRVRGAGRGRGEGKGLFDGMVARKERKTA